VATRRDYDSDPDRFRRGSRLAATYLRPGISLYDTITGLLAQRGAQHVLDLGCGEGALAAAVDHLSGQAKPLVVGLDANHHRANSIRRGRPRTVHRRPRDFTEPEDIDEKS
jgi:methylase of polypeptide subunit release factors